MKIFINEEEVFQTKYETWISLTREYGKYANTIGKEILQKDPYSLSLGIILFLIAEGLKVYRNKKKERDEIQKHKEILDRLDLLIQHKDEDKFYDLLKKNIKDSKLKLKIVLETNAEKDLHEPVDHLFY